MTRSGCLPTNASHALKPSSKASAEQPSRDRAAQTASRIVVSSDHGNGPAAVDVMGLTVLQPPAIHCASGLPFFGRILP
jgi:hypothetical protein